MKLSRQASLGKRLLGECGEAGGEIDRADDFVAHARLNAAFPACDERRARSAFVDAVLAAGVRAGGAVLADLLDRSVLVAVVEHRAVVAAEDDERVFRQLQSIERLHQFADAPVEFNDRVAAKAE